MDGPMSPAPLSGLDGGGTAAGASLSVASRSTGNLQKSWCGWSAAPEGAGDIVLEEVRDVGLEKMWDVGLKGLAHIIEKIRPSRKWRQERQRQLRKPTCETKMSEHSGIHNRLS